MDSMALDGIIQKLLGVKGSKPGKQVQLLEAEIRQLYLVSKDIFLQQPNLLELEAPIKICGDIWFNVRLWKVFTDCFNCLPVAALIDEKILCMHGGLSPDLHNLDQIQNLAHPTDVPDSGLLCDLLWSDPSKEKHDLDLICRAHQVVEDGYELFADRQLVTIFSTPNYCGEFDNSGAIMSVDETLMCSFQILKPAALEKKKFRFATASRIGTPCVREARAAILFILLHQFKELTSFSCFFWRPAMAYCLLIANCLLKRVTTRSDVSGLKYSGPLRFLALPVL
ncbi:hypothetical protein ZIOFF_002819 [Zingiber officinale]|uniref:protein-serine/threonine phosphatase n=1 Tax=Zingiber officinale TaxID=94328 RepID=A0A8J5IM78_ZINOF|nr:hypothetical protein ZIOFF_002819 [Zingiber officinale]